MPAVSLADVAKAAGVSQMTASRALRNQPRCSETTKNKVLEVAAKLGYRIDPNITKMMGYLRQAKAKPITETLAFVWTDLTPYWVGKNEGLLTLLNAARQRAQQLGFGLDEFWLRHEGMTTRRLNQILTARGIRGVILAPLVTRVHGHLNLRWERFASVSIGLGLISPSLHRVHVNHAMVVLTAMRAVKKLGYNRIGASLSEDVDRRSLRAFSGAFFAHHPLGAAGAGPLLHFHGWQDKRAFQKWVTRERPDVVVSDFPEQLDWLLKMGLKVPDQIGFATLNWDEQNPFIGGVDQNVSLSGSHAVDLTVSQFHRDEKGIPDAPKSVMHSTVTWHQGESVVPLRTKTGA